MIFDRTGPTPPGPFNIDIGTAERLDLNTNAGDDTVTADPGFAGFSLDVEGGDGNDSIDGGDAADVLAGGAGNDRIVPDDNPAGTRDVARGDAGDDTIVWNPGDDDDTNDGGDGNDISEVNGGSGGERFTVKPSSVPGRVLFDRTAPTPPGPFNIDIGTTELLRLNAGGGNDVITGAKGLAGRIVSELNGDDGNDSILGTDAADRLNGGAGRDLLQSRDKAEDLVDCGTGFDLALVDKRDFVRGCNIVLGGARRVSVPAGAIRGRPRDRRHAGEVRRHPPVHGHRAVAPRRPDARHEAVRDHPPVEDRSDEAQPPWPAAGRRRPGEGPCRERADRRPR